MKYLILIGVVFMFACVKEPVALYEDKPIIEVSSPTSTENFQVRVAVDTFPPPPDTSYDHGYRDTSYVVVTLEEHTGKKVRFTEVTAQLYDKDGEYIAIVGQKALIPPRTNEEQDTVKVNVPVIIDGGDAEDLDDADGIRDYQGGSGYLSFAAEGRDLDHGIEATSLESYTPMEASTFFEDTD